MKKLGLKTFFVVMTTLQRRPKFGKKMAKSCPSMDQCPPKNHRMNFLVHENHSMKLKRKKNGRLAIYRPISPKPP